MFSSESMPMLLPHLTSIASHPPPPNICSADQDPGLRVDIVPNQDVGCYGLVAY